MNSVLRKQARIATFIWVSCAAAYTLAQKTAVIVNVDARVNSRENLIVRAFWAGTYSVTPIGISKGGAYDAWCGFTTTTTCWRHFSGVSSDQFLAKEILGGGGTYLSPGDFLNFDFDPGGGGPGSWADYVTDVNAVGKSIAEEPPPAPYPELGLDPTPDDFDCCQYLRKEE